MKFEKLRLVLLRLKLENDNFYEDIIFQNSIIRNKFKNQVSEWMLILQSYQKTKISKFKDLFTELSEVNFPIKIDKCYGSYSLSLEFSDNIGHTYYMFKRYSLNHFGISEYSIGRRNSPIEPSVDREFNYRICKDGTIKLTDTSVTKLDEYDRNDNFVVEFYYNYEDNNTEVVLKSYEVNDKVRIKYPTISNEFNQKVVEYLFDISKTTWYYYDVFPILEWIAKEMHRTEISISIIAEVDEEVSSEIQVVNGIVQKYTIIKIINESETQKFTVILSKSLERFLKENI